MNNSVKRTEMGEEGHDVGFVYGFDLSQCICELFGVGAYVQMILNESIHSFHPFLKYSKKEKRVFLSMSQPYYLPLESRATLLFP